MDRVARFWKIKTPIWGKKPRWCEETPWIGKFLVGRFMERTEDGEMFFFGGGPVVFGHFFRFLDKIPGFFFG